MGKQTSIYTPIRTLNMSGLLLFMCLISWNLFAEEYKNQENKHTAPRSLFAAEPLEDAIFKLRINKIFLGNLPVICNAEKTYVDLSALLGFLGFTYTTNPESRVFTTACPDSINKFTIVGDTLFYQDRKNRLPQDIQWSEDQQLYISTTLFSRLTSIRTEVTYSALALDLETVKDVPVMIRRKRDAQLKKLLTAQKNALKIQVDTLPLNNFHLNSMGYMFTPYLSPGNPFNLGYGGNLTGELLKGSFIANYNNNTAAYASEGMFTFNWSLPPTRHKAVRQVNVFRNYPDLIMDYRGLANAVYISNQRPGDVQYVDYNLTGKGLPNSEVDVYKNGHIITSIRTDSLGHYALQMPLPGGDNEISAVSYDRFAEAQYDTRTIFLSPDLLRAKKLNYEFAGGYIDDGNAYVQGMMKYGITNTLTLTIRNETMWGRCKPRSIVMLGANYAYNRAFRISAHYIPGVRWNTSVFGDLHNWISASFAYEQYRKGQQMIRFTTQKQIAFTLNGQLPIPIVRTSLHLNAHYYEYQHSSSFITTARLNMNYNRLALTATVNTYAQNKMSIANPSYEIRTGYNLNSKIYNDLYFEHFSYHHQNRLRNRTTYRVNNRINGYAEAEYNFAMKRAIVNVGFSWKLPGVQLRSTLYATKGYSATTVQTSGSLIFSNHKRVIPTYSYVAGANLQVIPYLDINGNEQYDDGERIMHNTNIILRGAAETIRNAQGIFFVNIPTNSRITIIVPSQQLGDISWQITPYEHTFMFSAHQTHPLFLPVHVYSEVSGTITCREDNKPIEDLRVIAINTDTGKRSIARTDEWGHFEYTTLTSGKYQLEIDAQELAQRNLTICKPVVRHIEIKQTEEGQQIQDIDFTLEKIPALTTAAKSI